MKRQIVKYFVLIYVLSVVLMGLSRLILFASVKGLPLEEEYNLVGKIFQNGYFFDSLMTSYALILPIVFLLFYSCFSTKISARIWRNITRIITVIFIIFFAISFVDIPYFKYSNSHLSVSALGYMKYFKTTISMLFSESSYWIYFLLFIVFAVVIRYLLRLIAKKTVLSATQIATKKYPFILLFFVLGIFCFLGMRGTLNRYPLRISDASFCTNALFNKITVNPVFYFMKNVEKSLKGKKFNRLGNVVPLEKAYKTVQKELGVVSENPKTLAREVRFEEEGNKANVIVILCESLSFEHLKMKRKDGSLLLPFFEELKQKSYFFENCYSAANHTNNGILATLYGMPTIFNRPSLDNKDNFYTGLPQYLKNHGYLNYFFMGGNPNYDNMKGFLYSCGSIDKIYSLEEYPSGKSVNNFGVADDFLFEFGLKELNKKAEKAPFLATFLTVSNHPPYIIPEKYKNNDESETSQILMFVNDTLHDFFEEALQQSWAKNTIFVVLGDHGAVVGNEKLPMPLSYNHIPMLIYSELFKDKAQVCEQFGGQIDVPATVMGMLKLPYVNSTFGIDLFREKREQMFFVGDTHLGCINEELLYTYDTENKTEGLFEYKKENAQNQLKELPELAEKMKNYGFSMMKVAQEEILKE
ncbi:MAG: sulfatase-like hydrolase/transferase [Flavobacteriaceae bacterium]|nr:sulfatase-like hydrolase/transferase [Flavobacteriaceae bacterium]